MVAIGGIADIVQHWHEMARSRMTQSGHQAVNDLFALRHQLGFDCHMHQP
jgi:hypothetical protein